VAGRTRPLTVPNAATASGIRADSATLRSVEAASIILSINDEIAKYGDRLSRIVTSDIYARSLLPGSVGIALGVVV